MLVYMQVIDAPSQKSKFEQLYLRYRGLMYYVAEQILHNPQDAEDAVHNAFLYIAENMQKISDPACPKTKSYIVTIAESKAIDLYRKKQRHPQLPWEEETVGMTVEHTEAHTIAACIAKLPSRYRVVLLLKYSHGYTGREIGKLMGITAANADKLLQRAKAKLEILCKEEGLL